MTSLRFISLSTAFILATSVGLVNCGDSGDSSGDPEGGAGADGGDGDVGDGDVGDGDGDVGDGDGDDGTGGTAGDGDGGPSVTPCDSDTNCLAMNLVCDLTRRLCAECVEYTDCDDGNVCVAGVCEPYTSCESSLDCGSPDLVCIQNEVLGGRCLDCGMPADCNDGDTCVSNECHTICESDGDCFALGQLCNFSGGFCADCVDGVGCEDDEYCDGLTCRPQVCDPGSTACFDNSIVTCTEEGTALSSPVSCNGFDCVVEAGQAKCDYPESVMPEGALNTNGDFAAAGTGWHLESTIPAPIEDGMFCITNDYTADFGWPNMVGDAFLLENGKEYTVTFRTVFTPDGLTSQQLNVKIGLPETPYTEFHTESLSAAEGVELHEFTFSMDNATSAAGIVFALGAASGTMCLDDVWIVPAEN